MYVCMYIYIYIYIFTWQVIVKQLERCEQQCLERDLYTGFSESVRQSQQIADDCGVHEALSFLAEEYVDLTVAPWTQEWSVVCVYVYVIQE